LIKDFNILKQFRSNSLIDSSIIMKDSLFEQLLFRWAIDEDFFFSMLSHCSKQKLTTHEELINIFHQYPRVCFSNKPLFGTDDVLYFTDSI